MRVAKLYSFEDIRIEDIPVPEIGPDDALIKTKACGICSGDVMPWYIEKKAPLVLGHEPVGEIIDVGSRVVSFKKGDRVFTHHHAPCLMCRFCRQGDYVQCATWKSSSIIPGGISEYILIPSINLEHDTIRLSEEIGFEDGTLIEPAACVVKALKRAKIAHGDTVLVIGLGVMGLMNLLLVREYGAGKVIGADRVKFRLGKALELGADDIIDISKDNLYDGLRSITDGNNADLAVVCPNSVDAMIQGINCIRPGGQVLFFTPAEPGEKLTIDPNYLYFNDINILTSYSCGPDDTADAHELIKKGVITADKLVTHRFPIEKTAEAFMLTFKAENSLKSLIVFD